ncbi:MAG: hypothetical protein ACSHYA_15470 [Opitutaceae bacterium]
MESIFEIPLREMLDGLSMNSRDAVDRLLEEIDVEYLVAFESPDGSNRQLIAVGPELEYSDFNEVSKMQIDDMFAAFYANAGLAKGVRRLSDPQAEKELEEAFAQKLRQAEEKIAGLKERCIAAEAANEALESEIEALRGASDEASFKKKFDQLEDRVAQVSYRDQELHIMEEEMVSRMNDYMEKVAELEQWEENLFHREAAINKRAENSA